MTNKEKIMDFKIDYDNSGEPIHPSYDPLTQTLERVEVDGVEYWRITSYSIEDRNDGSEPYKQFFIARRDSTVASIDRIKQLAPLWEELTEEEKQQLISYRDTVAALEDFSPGFKFPVFTANIPILKNTPFGVF
jgi:hypothetical protein